MRKTDELKKERGCRCNKPSEGRRRDNSCMQQQQEEQNDVGTTLMGSGGKRLSATVAVAAINCTASLS